MYRAPIMVEIIPRDGKMSSQAACILLDRTSICGRRKEMLCIWFINHLRQELEPTEYTYVSVLLFTAELNEIGTERERVFFFLKVFLL